MISVAGRHLADTANILVAGWRRDPHVGLRLDASVLQREQESGLGGVGA